MIIITRADPTAGMPDHHRPLILSEEHFDDWPAAIASLKGRGIPLTEDQCREIEGAPDTQFAWPEFIQVADVAYNCNVNYDIRVSADERA